MKYKIVLVKYAKNTDEDPEYLIKEVNGKEFIHCKECFVLHQNKKWTLVDKSTGMKIFSRNTYSQLELDWHNNYELKYHAYRLQQAYKNQIKRFQKLCKI